MTEYIKTNGPSITAGTMCAILFGLIAAWSQSDREFWLMVMVLAVLTLPIFIPASKILWFDLEEAKHARAKESQSVERAWEQEAAAIGFWILFSGLIYLDILGSLLEIGWMAPISTIHVLVLGGAAFLGSYFWKKRNQG